MKNVAEANKVLDEFDAQWFIQRGIDDERVIAAIGKVPRKPFVIVDEQDDEHGPLPNRALPPMDVVGKLLSSLEIEPQDKILEIGTDTGYITALLADMGDEVFSVERRLPMAKLAEGRLEQLQIENVEILYGPRLTEYALNAPYDAILLSAVAPRVPGKLKTRLAIGGRMVVPIGEGGRNPEVICIRRIDEKTYEKASLGQLRFSSKIGDILVELGIADREDVELAALEADAQGQRVGEALLEHSLVQEADLVRALAIQRGHRIAPVDTLLQIADHELAYSAPRAFLKHHQLMPLDIRDDKLHIATVDPDAPTVELARLLDAEAVETYLVTTEEFHRIWNTILEGRRPQQVQRDNLKARVEAKFEKILGAAEKLGAQTVHIDHFPQGGKVRFRVSDGLRQIPEMAFGPSEIDYLIEFLKFGADLDVLEQRIPQRGRFYWTPKETTYHLRVHVMPSIRGEQVAVRLLSEGKKPDTLSELGFPDFFIENIDILLEKLNGVFLVVGPRKARKKETLYALLSRQAADTSRKVCTVEEEILRPIPGAQQVVTAPEQNFDYREAIREFMQFDVDVVGLAEIPNPHTALDVLRASTKGPMMLATLHGKDAGHVLDGMRQFGVPGEEIARGICGILTQWQAPKICESCREIVPLNEVPVLEIFGDVGPPHDFKAFHGTGCPDCRNTGVRGEVPVLELLPFGDTLRQAVIDNRSERDLRRIASNSGVEMLSEYAIHLAKAGLLPIYDLARYIRISASR